MCNDYFACMKFSVLTLVGDYDQRKSTIYAKSIAYNYECYQTEAWHSVMQHWRKPVYQLSMYKCKLRCRYVDIDEFKYLWYTVGVSYTIQDTLYFIFDGYF